MRPSHEAMVIVAAVLISQVLWLVNTYQTTKRQIMVEAKEAFLPAYQKEQTYRVPFIDIVNSGAVIIESCGPEEMFIIRQCPDPDTIIYSNLSGHSIESVINSVFVNMREQITPINIYCMADLYAGLLYEKDIHANFVIERFETTTDEIFDSSLLPDKKQPKPDPAMTVVMDISGHESLRAVLEIPSIVIFRRMAGTIVLATVLTFIIIVCLYRLYFKKTNATSPITETFTANASTSPADAVSINGNNNQPFTIGQYTFNPAKNELYGFGENFQLNKKENTILYKLCAQRGFVVERNILLNENWGSSGIIYSRSLDTYITALRKFLKKDSSVQIITIKGVGYKLVISGD